MGNNQGISKCNSTIAQPPTDSSNEISIFDYQIENFLAYNLDSQESLIIHIFNKNKKYTLVDFKETRVLNGLQNIHQIYYQDKIFILNNAYEKSDPFIILNDEDFISKDHNLIKIDMKAFGQMQKEEIQTFQRNTIQQMTHGLFINQHNEIKKINTLKTSGETNKTKKFQKQQKKSHQTVSEIRSHPKQLLQEFTFFQKIQLNQKRFQNSLIYNFYKLLHSYQTAIEYYIDFASKFDDEYQVEMEYKNQKNQTFHENEEKNVEQSTQQQNIKMQKLHKHINFIYEINRNPKDVKKQQKAEYIIMKKIQSLQFRDLVNIEDALQNMINKFNEQCLIDTELILQGKIETQPNNILYGMKNDQYLLSNTVYIKIHDRDGGNYKQLKQNVLLQEQFYHFHFQKEIAVPFFCIIRANEYIFYCVSEMPVKWENNNKIDPQLIRKFEQLNKIKYQETSFNLGSNIYENDFHDQYFPKYSLINLQDLGIRFFSNFIRCIRPEFYQKQNCILHIVRSSTFFSEQLMIQECSYKLQRKIYDYTTNPQKISIQKQQIDDLSSNMNNYFTTIFDPTDILDFIENKFLNNVIISVLNYFDSFQAMTFEQLKSYFHFNGINLKHIGYILQRLIRLQQNKQLIYFKNLLTTEVLSRTIKNILIHNIWDFEKNQPVYKENESQVIDQDFSLFLDQKIDFFLSQIEQIQNNKEKTFQNICFIKQIQKYFGFPHDNQFKNLDIDYAQIKNNVQKMILKKQKKKFLILKNTEVPFLSKQLISNYMFKPDLYIENKKNIYRTFQKIIQNKLHYKIHEMNQDFQLAFGLDEQFRIIISFQD